MIDWSGILTLANLIILVGGGIGGFLSLRSSLAKSKDEIKERVLNDLSKENEILRNRVQRLEAENKRQAKLIQLLVTTLKKTHGIELDIEEDVVTLRSPNGNVSRVSTDV